MRIALSVLLFLSVAAKAEPSLLMVDAVFKRAADNPHYEPCIPSEDDKAIGMECINVEWGNWQVYLANTQQHILGPALPKKFEFGIYMHASFNNKFLEKFYVLLEPSTDKELTGSLGTSYTVIDISPPDSIACFESDLESIFPTIKITAVKPEVVSAPSDYFCYKMASVSGV